MDNLQQLKETIAGILASQKLAVLAYSIQHRAVFIKAESG
jgi:hypothetical protein